MDIHKRFFDRRDNRDDPGYWSATAEGGMVVTAHYLASDAGIKMLNQGGNAFDAAVAGSLALSACESAGSGLGGMGMMLAHTKKDNRTFTVEGPCRAPGNVAPDRINRKKRYRGYQAIAVPGLVAVLDHVLKKYGNLSVREVAEPAIDIARNGYPVTHMQNELINYYRKSLKTEYVKELFLTPAGRAVPAGTILKQPDLAYTLELLADRGLQDFYLGRIAELICKDMEVNQGFVSREDLSGNCIPRESEPLLTKFDDNTAVSIGPPAGALSLMQLLKAADGMDRKLLSMDEPAGIVRVAGMIRKVRVHRREYRLCIGAEDLGSAAEWLDEKKVNEIIDFAFPDDGTGETSHLCVADAEGNWISMTQSIERSFGAGVATPGLGFFYNGFIKTFKIRNQKHPHYLKPGIPARSNAAPTFLLRDGSPVLAIGSTGSERMQSGIFEVLVRLRDHGPFDSVHAPRLHCTPEGEVMIESERFPASCISALELNGFRVKPVGPYSFTMGGLQLLVCNGPAYTGVSEPRRDGSAAGI